MTAPPYVPGHNLLAGKTVLITAAAGTGIGFATAKRCVEEGATVVISDKHERRCGESAAELGVVGIPCDVTNEESVQALFAGATEALAKTGHGGIDVLINNAGLGGTVELHEMTDDQWNIVLDVTLNGTFRCMRAGLQHMYERGSGVPGPEASIGKLFWANWHRDLGELVIDLQGMSGVAHDEGELTLEQKLFLFTRSDTIYGGSNEIQRNVLGERVLGLPKEPQP